MLCFLLFKWNQSHQTLISRVVMQTFFDPHFEPLMALFSRRFLILLVMMRWLSYYQTLERRKGRKNETKMAPTVQLHFRTCMLVLCPGETSARARGSENFFCTKTAVSHFFSLIFLQIQKKIK